jgi:hypothetical protein
MFRCQMCQSVVSPGIPAQRVVLEVRKQEYPFRSRANVIYQKPKDGKKSKAVRRDDPGGVGHEIVREVLACPSCANDPP